MPDHDTHDHSGVPGVGGTPDAEDVTFDPTGLDNTAATDVQAALEDYDAAITAAAGGVSLAAASYKRPPSTGNYTTTSTTFADVDGSNTNLTISTGAHRVMIMFTGTAKNSTNTFSVYFDVDIDGTRFGNGDAGIIRIQSAPAGGLHNASFTVVTSALSAGSHTFKLRWRVDGNTATIMNTGTDEAQVVTFAVVELPM